MKLSLLIAAVLILLLGLVHSVLGERYILVRLFRRDLPRLFGNDTFTKHTLRFAWHLTTVVWLGIAALLVQMGVGRPVGVREIGAVLAVTAGASALVALLGSRGRHPAWLVFLVVAALAWLGTQ